MLTHVNLRQLNRLRQALLFLPFNFLQQRPAYCSGTAYVFSVKITRIMPRKKPAVNFLTTFFHIIIFYLKTHDHQRFSKTLTITYKNLFFPLIINFRRHLYNVHAYLRDILYTVDEWCISNGLTISVKSNCSACF